MGAGSSQSEVSTGQTSTALNIPDDLLIDILKWLPAQDIVTKCALVSRQIRDIVAGATLWRIKCELEEKYVHGLMPAPADFKRLYFLNPYARNLVKNPCASEGLRQWDVIREGGDELKVETDRNGSQNIEETDIVKEWPGKPIRKWATSYGPCEKRQVIDLLKEGVDPIVLDELKSPIYISEWYAARFDCACYYELDVKLLSSDKKVLEKYFFKDDIPQWTDGEWTKVEHTFKNYPPGVRFVEFRHLGNDKQFWAGHYGSKFTMSTVKFVFKKNS